MAFKKTVQEKLETKFNSLSQHSDVIRNGHVFSVGEDVLLEVSDTEMTYGIKRYSPTSTDPLWDDNFAVTLHLSHENLSLVNSNPINPPKGSKKVFDVFKNIEGVNIQRIHIGTAENSLNGNDLYVAKDLYTTINEIDREEGKDKRVRVFNRIIPFFNSEFGIDISEMEVDRNYSLLLKEILSSGEFSQQDIESFTEKLEEGESAKVVIEKQINKQTEWLISTIESLLEIDRLTKPKAKDFGSLHFKYSKVSITGPEHLMEKILTDYGQYSLFGVPALLNTDKYVIHEGSSRSQFDLILINHLGDIELVELKRPDQYLFDYGNGRGKFYPSKDLAIAISQTERYITAVTKDHDDEYLIDGKKIRDFINDEIGNTMFVESIRPKALIIIGSWEKLAKDYDSLSTTTKSKVTKEEYDQDCLQAYKELQHSLKNIKIMTYSELLENARTRLELTKENNNA
ncbi:Shedu anti-phage system protein SduA domain-containing protein [Algoriphagus vanfongensis]|uniref:Shedu anti-phage system protein SduA domain-containing protein n=1 Tax=Algoriphagus vanfongensis TaxID=426371 RepID=UPI000408C364|nr:Shedu anti-phage system protein SduA domain-containing protein [Algoriphagus vanfongensis]